MRSRDTFGVLGVGAFAVVCCAGLPAVLAFLGGASAVGLLGGGLLAAVLVGVAASLAIRVRRRRAAGTPDRKAET
jgi:hypothetical protein